MAGQDEQARQGEPVQVAQEAPADQRRADAHKVAKLVFKDPLSQQTSDDTDSGWGESGAGRGLDWYLSQRPPHHGD
ncbi:hypothetical protein GCM10009665_43640 [Kitasatospora nipponensis]|uniref:Uncharacterized protein n=1 Tax=Kitasatospora nipponensis TaxID=258049 RepID=A0ABN1WGY5_9ACTN